MIGHHGALGLHVLLIKTTTRATKCARVLDINSSSVLNATINKLRINPVNVVDNCVAMENARVMQAIA